MKPFLVILLSLFLFCCQYSKSDKSQLPADTAFLYKWDTVEAGFRRFQEVFIETNRNTEWYDRVADFRFSPYDNMEHSFEAIREKGVRLAKVNTLGLPSEWTGLYQYREKNYVYHACDGPFILRTLVSDTAVVFWGHEPIPYVLTSVKKTDDSTYSLTTTDALSDGPGFLHPDTINIYILDQKTKAAVWEYKARGESVFQYLLLVPREHIRDYDLIVNHTSDRFDEFTFDTVDFAQLLQNRKRPHR